MAQRIENSQEIGKSAAAKAASELVQNGMTIGLGSGSTALKFIDFLAQRCATGLKIKAVASSKVIANYAMQLGIELVDFLKPIDLDIDGADEIDANKQMIKGGGGALLWEKILASSSREMIVMVNSTKLVDRLGAFPLPVEIVPFGHTMTQKKIESLGVQGHLRMSQNKPFITDSGNLIFDIHTSPSNDLIRLHNSLKEIPGVIETGLFINLAGRVIVGYPDNKVKIL